MPRSVLLVEDDDAIRESLSEFLTREGYQTFTARNGRDALTWLAANDRPGVILLDLMMPVTNGMQFLTVRGRDTALRDIPVVVMTAWVNRWKDAVRDDVDGVLAKPIDSEKLLAIVSRYCELAGAQGILCWARLKIDSPIRIRRGAWYRVTATSPSAVAIDVGDESLLVPAAVLELVDRKPSRWTVVPRPLNASLLLPASWGDCYGVCPNCAHRAPVFRMPNALACPMCGRLFPVAWEEAYLGRRMTPASS